MLKVQDISKFIKKSQLLNNISFEVAKGEVLGIIGPNGAGKSTLLKILALVMQPDHGTYQIMGRNALKRQNSFRELMGYVPQDVALYEALTVKDNLIYWSNPAKNHNVSKLDTILRQYDLDKLASKKVSTLSGGMKRRLNLAVAMVNNPQILIMDEPMVGIDILQRQMLREHLVDLSEKGVTQVITSHEINSVIDLLDVLLILHEGRVLYCQRKETFLSLSKNNQRSLDGTILELIYS